MLRRVTFLLLLAVFLPAPVWGQALNDLEKQIVELTNKFRASEDVGKLTVNATLMQVAQAHARNMAGQDKYGDTDKDGHVLDGKGPVDRIKAAGYQYARMAENVGMVQGFEEPAVKVLEGWEKSPGHRKNLLTKDFSEIGVGAAQGKSGRWYFVQVFGRPASQASKVRVVIENNTRHTIPFQIDDKKYDLGPGYTGQFWFSKSSGPIVMSVTWPDPKAEGVKITLRNQARYVFVQKGSAFAVQTLEGQGNSEK